MTEAYTRIWDSNVMRVDFHHDLFNYIEDVTGINIVYDPANADVRLNSAGIPLYFDGVAIVDGDVVEGVAYIDDADISIKPEFADQDYIFLHEMGHVLGLRHPDDLSVDFLTTSDTLMNHIPTGDTSKISEYAPYDLALLNWRYHGKFTDLPDRWTVDTATQWGRDEKLLGANESATNGLLVQRADAANVLSELGEAMFLFGASQASIEYVTGLGW